MLKNSVFRIALQSIGSTALYGQLRPLLSGVEQDKANRFLVEQPRLQFIACRAALRLILAKHLGCRATDVCLKMAAYGKPILAHQQPRSVATSEASTRNPTTTVANGQVSFNVSHSGDFGLIALSDGPVGIDIERRQPRINAKSLVSQVLSPEEMVDWQRLSAANQAEQILRLWVCKEAVLKAMGLGIADCLQKVSFALPIDLNRTAPIRRIDPSVQIYLEESANCRLHAWTISNYWNVQPLEIAPEYLAAIAAPSTAPPFQLIDLEWEQYL